MKRRVRVLVCGTNYGQHYLRAIEREPRKYELVGILARGSLRSTLMAAQYDVPLYLDVGQVPDIDAAFAAMGPAGNDSVLALLRRGADVLCEHPLPAPFVRKALATAEHAGAVLHVNAHFSLLDAPRAFIKRCVAQRKREEPAFVDVLLSPRLLYAFFDITRHALGPLQPRRNTIAGVPLAMQLERLMPDGSASNLVDCRIAVGFPGGILTLLSAAGPVIWTGNYRRETRTVSETVFAREGLTRDEFFQQRLDAISASMASLVRHATAPGQSLDHLLDVSRATDFAIRTIRALKNPTASDSRAETV